MAADTPHINLPGDATPCPPWCESIQCHETDSRDRFHQRLCLVPVIVRHLDAAMATITLEPVEACVTIFKNAVHDDELWVSIEVGDEGPGITVSRESAQRLHQVLGEVLALLEGTSPRS